jgi:TRAP transporter TAXI family solute receptor
MKWRILLAAAGAAMLLASPTLAQNYGIGTTGQGSATYSMGSAIAKIAAEKAQLQMRVQPYTGTTQAVPLVNSGELDLLLCNVLEGTSAVEGTGPFKGKPNPNLRLVSVLQPFNVGYFVKKDSPIKTIKDLKGKKIATEFTGQAIIKVLSQAMLATAGLTTADVDPVPVPNIVRGADDFAEGKTDAFFFALGSGKVTQVDAAVGGIRLLPIDNTPEALAGLRKFVPQAYIATTEPGKNNPGVTEKTPVMAYDYLMLAGAHVKDDVVYKVAKLVHDNKDALVASFSGFAGFNPDTMAKDLPITYHPGAIKLLTETKQWPVKK